MDEAHNDAQGEEDEASEHSEDEYFVPDTCVEAPEAVQQDQCSRPVSPTSSVQQQ